MKSAAIVVKIWYSASFQEKHFQKIRSGPENRFRIFRFFIQPKTKKTRGTDRNPAQPRPETPSAYRLATQKYTFPTKKQGRNDTFPRCRHIHHRKKKATRPKTSHLRPLQDKNDKSLKPTPKMHHSQQNNPKGKTIPVFQGRQCVWNPYPKAHPPFHFSKMMV